MKVLLWLSVLALAIGAAGVGWQLGGDTPGDAGAPIASIPTVRPVPASDPSVPWTVLPDCPVEAGSALPTNLTYVRRHQVSDGKRWTFLVPKGWARNADPNSDRPTQSVWVPPGDANYRLRTFINLVRQAPSDLADWQTKQMLANYSTAELVRPTLDRGVGTPGDRISQAFYSFRTDEGNCRLNYFAWLRPAGWTDTPIEMSVSGRVKDAEGLEELLTTVLDSFAVRDHAQSSASDSPDD